MLWAVFAGLSLGAVMLMAWPLITRGAANSMARASADQAVYRAQLGELDDDLARGLIDDREAATARIEIERRLLGAAAAGPAAGPADAPAQAPRRWLPAALIAVTLPALAFALYAELGAPKIPAVAFAERAAGDAGEVDFKALTERLAAKMTERPDNIEGWRLLGRSYAALGNYTDAADAFRRATELDNSDVASQVSLAENLTLAADGIVSDEAREIFRQALRLEPGQPGARYYLALADLQAGNARKAYEAWLAMAEEAPPEAPWLEAVSARLGEAAQALGIEPPVIINAAAPSPAPRPAPRPARGPARGPDAEDIAAAATMDDSQRSAFVESMVARLAAQLEREPDDIGGWFRLARAYTVLGRHRDAAAAYDQILSREPDNPDALWLAGIAAASDSAPKVAAGHWRRLLAQLDPASQDYADLKARIDELKPQ